MAGIVPHPSARRRLASPQLEHLETLRAYVEAGEPCNMRYEPPLHIVHEGPTTLSVELDREAFLRFLPLDF